MKQRDAALSSRSVDGKSQDYGVGAGESGPTKRGDVDSSAAAAASAAAVATATAAAAAAQQRIRGLEVKVADLEAKLELALAEKDRQECKRRTASVHALLLLTTFKMRAGRDHVCGACARGGRQRGANGSDCQGCSTFLKNR